MKQADLERINRLVISPMNAIWNAKVPEGMIEAMVEDLSGYDDNTLTAAMREVRRSSRHRPTIAQLIEACDLHKPASQPQAAKANAHFQRNEALADQVMRSPIGQKAIALGVSTSVWIHAYRDGKADFTESDLERYRQEYLRGVEDLNNVAAGPLREALEGIYNAMQKRERELAERFG